MSSVLREEQQVFDVSRAKDFCALTDHYEMPFNACLLIL
jgi:hypothetical protein